MSIESVFGQLWGGRTIGPAFLVAAVSDIAIGLGLGVVAVVGTDDTTTALILGVVALVMVAFGTLMTVAVVRLRRRQSGGATGTRSWLTVGDYPGA